MDSISSASVREYCDVWRDPGYPSIWAQERVEPSTNAWDVIGHGQVGMI